MADAAATISVSTENVVENASADTVVYLYRGTRLVSAATMREKGCARGDAVNAGCGRPTEKEVITQVGGYQGGGDYKKYPEFTTSLHWARVYATDCVSLVAIEKKYLTKGSVSECGWVCYDGAPCRLIAAYKYTPPGGPPKTLVNSVTGKKMIAD